MKIGYEFFTVIAFFAAYKFADIYIATAILMLLLAVKATFTYIKYKKIETMDMVTLVIVLAAGGLTLWLKNPDFIKYKPTLVNGLFSAVLLIGHYALNKNCFQILFSKQMKLPQSAWDKLLHLWAIFFIFMAILNAYIAAYFSEEFWVNFKIWGFVFPFITVIISGFLLMPYLKQDSQENKQDSENVDNKLLDDK